MSEVLGDAEPSRDGDDFKNGDLENGDLEYGDDEPTDDYEYDDGLDAEPGAFRQAIASVFTPAALAIGALTVATMTLFAPLPNYLATPLAISHQQDPLYGERAVAVSQLVAAAIGIILAVLAIRGTRNLDEGIEGKRRLPLMLAGAALVIMAVSVLQAIVGLIVLANTHVPNFG